MSTVFVFMDGSARLYQATIVNECLQSEFIYPIEWPAFSPGLNPAQHVRHMIGQRVSALQPPPPTYVPKLRRAMLGCGGSNLPQDQLYNIILSLSRQPQINRESVRQLVTQNLGMRKTCYHIDDIPNIQRNVTMLLNTIPKEDFLQSFQDMYSRSQGCIVLEGNYFEKKKGNFN
ncbi:DDE_3 domain-containing protein [Trichonephila clavipes]|nr:DDE_3 domain-containing protein [Trichonephila clavipes]